MRFTIYKNEVGQLMAMEGHCEFDGVIAKVFDLEGSVLEVHKQPETPLEHYWFNLGHQSNKIAEENNYLREKLAKAREALEFYADGEPVIVQKTDPKFSEIEKEMELLSDHFDVSVENGYWVKGKRAREALKGE